MRQGLLDIYRKMGSTTEAIAVLEELAGLCRGCELARARARGAACVLVAVTGEGARGGAHRDPEVLSDIHAKLASLCVKASLFRRVRVGGGERWW